MKNYGAESMIKPLRDVLLVPPGPIEAAHTAPLGWTPTDPRALTAQFQALHALLEQLGARVHLGTASTLENPDAIYAYDSILVTRAGVIALNPGKKNRRSEPQERTRDLDGLGIPLLGKINAPGFVEAGDLLWLRDDLLIAGLGWRTNREGLRQLRALLSPLGVDVEAYDLPNAGGRDECLHLMSLVSLIRDDLAVIEPQLIPVRLLQRFEALGVECVHVAPGEYDTQGTNVLAVREDVIIALDCNPDTNARLQAAGVDVFTIDGSALCLPGCGGPTCLTRPLWRA